ncbi:MAG: hypothetical protein Q8R96_02655 [Bacteroidota bacterium]|nr:hypothetical protein [Bacteroidota bacterium]
MIKTKNNIKYIVLVMIAMALVWYQYGMNTALLGFVVLTSMLFLLINFVRLYNFVKQKNYKKSIWYFLGVIVFSVIIFFLPERLMRFATSFCVVLILFYILYDLIIKKKNA